jgi:hypothetical protein
LRLPRYVADLKIDPLRWAISGDDYAVVQEAKSDAFTTFHGLRPNASEHGTARLRQRDAEFEIDLERSGAFTRRRGRPTNGHP